MPSGKPLPTRDDYRHFSTIPTRWMDNDVYGHVNNAVYYSFFDTAINGYLIANGCLDIHDGETIGLVVETMCRYQAPLAFPEPVDAGLAVARIGTSSVRYEVGLFRAGSDELCAFGHFVHVYVSRATRRPVEIPSQTRAVLERLTR
ncbi:MAG: acyl-CoA thioesterase [Beijerinckiaceae bacterium]|nr:acyl-CoA thioesterase [Beijerinckiaceae bacterium]